MPLFILTAAISGSNGSSGLGLFTFSTIVARTGDGTLENEIRELAR